MTAVRFTRADARALGLDTAPARRRTTRRVAAGPYRTRCHACGATFTSQAAEDRHLTDTRHLHYVLDLCGIDGPAADLVTRPG